MIRCWAFQPLVSAFDIVDLPLGKNTDPRYDDHVQETRRCMVRNFYRAVNIVFGSDFDEFEARLVDVIIKLNMSTGFNPTITEEFLNVIAATFVPHNANKKLFVFYGKNKTGKSYFCKLIQILNSPDVASVLDLKEITERANLNVKCNVIIINEISEVRAAQIKSITGNDESAKIFYTQDYEMHE